MCSHRLKLKAMELVEVNEREIFLLSGTKIPQT